MAHTLWPCSVTINYKTENAPHKMTIPLTAWSPPSSGHIAGTNLAWDGSQQDTDDFMDNLVSLFEPFFQTNTTFQDYTIYTYAAVNDPARPQVSQPLAIAGSIGSGVIPASQSTYNFKTVGFFPFKLVFLDTKVSATFLPKISLVSPADDPEIALRDFILADTSIIQGRDNTRVGHLVKITYTLNEKLRASYNID